MKEYTKNLICTISMCVIMIVYHIIRECNNVPDEFIIGINATVFIINIYIIWGAWIPMKKVREMSVYCLKGKTKDVKIKHLNEVIKLLVFNSSKAKTAICFTIGISLMLILWVLCKCGYKYENILNMIMDIQSTFVLCVIFWQIRNAEIVVNSVNKQTP